MAYTFSVNNVPATGPYAIYQLISTLMSAGWLKKMDSDGTTYSATGVQVTGGGTGTNGLGNNNAWVRLQAPLVNQGTVVDQTREFTFQRGTNDLHWRVKYSASALFTGGSPAAAVTPSSTDEVFMLGGGTDASPTFTNSWMSPNNTYHWHIVAGGAAEFYSFVAWSLNAGTTSGGIGVIALDAMQAGSHPTLDVDPAVVHCSSIAGSNVGFSQIITSWPSSNSTSPAQARAWLGATSAAGAATTSTNSQNVTISTIGSTSFGAQNANTNSVNPWTNKDDLLPAIWGRGLSSPAPKGVKGCSTLFEIGSVWRTNMSTLDVSGTRDKVHMNGLWIPWSGVKPII